EMEGSVGSEVFEKSLPIHEGQRRRIFLPRTAIQTILEGRDPAPLVRGSKGGRDHTSEPAVLTTDSREGCRGDRWSHIVSDGDHVDGDARESRVVLHGEVHRERTKAPECVPGPSVRTRVIDPVSEIPRIRRDVAVRVGRGPSVEEDVPTGYRIPRLEIK